MFSPDDSEIPTARQTITPQHEPPHSRSRRQFLLTHLSFLLQQISPQNRQQSHGVSPLRQKSSTLLSLPLQKQPLVQHQPLKILASVHVRVQQTFLHANLAQGDIDHQYSVHEFRSFWWTSNVFHKTNNCLHDSLCQCKAYVNVFYYVFLPVLQRSL